MSLTWVQFEMTEGISESRVIIISPFSGIWYDYSRVDHQCVVLTFVQFSVSFGGTCVYPGTGFFSPKHLLKFKLVGIGKRLPRTGS